MSPLCIVKKSSLFLDSWSARTDAEIFLFTAFSFLIPFSFHSDLLSRTLVFTFSLAIFNYELHPMRR